MTDDVDGAPRRTDRGLVSLPTWASPLFDSAGRAAVVLALSTLAGGVAIAVAWHEVALTLAVALELPWLVSGGIVGLAAVAASVALLGTHLDRRHAATNQAMRQAAFADLGYAAERLGRHVAARHATRAGAPPTI